MTPGTTDATIADEYQAPDGKAELGKDEPELTDEAVEALRREYVFVSNDKATPEEFPRMFNLSAGFMYHAVIRAEVPDRPEYVTITLPEPWSEEQSVALHNAVAQWNLLWEAAQFRRWFFDEDDLPPQLARIADRGDVNVYSCRATSGPDGPECGSARGLIVVAIVRPASGLPSGLRYARRPNGIAQQQVQSG